MMLAIERTAKQWINDELRELKHPNPFQDAPRVPLQVSPARWILPKLLRIVYDNTDQPVETLAPLIRAMLQEQTTARPGSDPCRNDQLETSLNETVALLIKVLERVRRQCMIQPRL